MFSKPIGIHSKMYYPINNLEFTSEVKTAPYSGH